MHDGLPFNENARHDLVEFRRAIDDIGHSERRLPADHHAGGAGQCAGRQRHNIIRNGNAGKSKDQNSRRNISS